MFHQNVEKATVQHILDLDFCIFGIPASDVLKLAFNLVKKMNNEYRLTKDKRMVGRDWENAFKLYYEEDTFY